MALPSGYLLHNATATTADANIVGIAAGVYCFAIDGTFDGATCTLQMLSPDGTSWLSITGAAFTAEGTVIVELPGARMRVLVAGGPPSAMYATLKKVRN